MAGEYGGALLYGPGAESSAPHSSMSPQRKAINHLFYDPGFCQDPAFTLPVSKVLLCLFLSQVLCLFLSQSFKTPYFRDFFGVDPFCSSGGWSYCAFAGCQPIPGKQSHDRASVPCYGKTSENPAPSLADLSWLPHFYSSEQCNMLVASILFITQGILRPCCHSWYSTLFCTFKPGTSHPPW